MKKSDYNKAKNILKRYSYNSIEITKKGIDILEDEHIPELQTCIDEYKCVRKALNLAHKDCEDILQKYYVKITEQLVDGNVSSSLEQLLVDYFAFLFDGSGLNDNE